MTCAVPEDAVAEFLADRPVAALPGVGAATARTLDEYGLDTLGRVAAAPLSTLQRLIGAKAGRELREKASGIDRGRVVPNAVSRSLTTERAFGIDELDPDRHRRGTAVGRRGDRRPAARGGEGLPHPSPSPCATRTARPPPAAAPWKEPTAHSAALTGAAYGMYEALGLQRARVRALALRAEGLTPAEEASYQLTFDPVDEKARRIEEVADRARARFGPRAVMPGALAA